LRFDGAVGIFTQVESEFVERENQPVHHRGIPPLVREVFVDLVEGHEAPLPGGFDQRLQFFVGAIHYALPY
jgi:hypothetical protein